jgi:signal transduction histidine kinase
MENPTPLIHTMKRRLLSSDALFALLPTLLLIGAQALVWIGRLLPTRDQSNLLGIILLEVVFTAFLVYGLWRAPQMFFPISFGSALGFSLLSIFLFRPFAPALDLSLFAIVAVVGVRRGVWAGLGFGVVAASLYSIVLFFIGFRASFNLSALLIFDAYLILVGGLSGGWARLIPKRKEKAYGHMSTPAFTALQAAQATSTTDLPSELSEDNSPQILREELYEMIMHDLKSPLGTMISALHILRETIPADGQPAHQALNAALKAGDRQMTLLDNLLDLQRLRAGALPLILEPIDLGPILNTQVGQIEPRAKRKSIQIEKQFGPTLPPVMVDWSLIERVIANLLENTYKFTPVNGQITVAAQPEPSVLRVIVADTGPGVPGPQRQVIFEKYRQIVNGETDAHDGTGLGLAFCKMVLEAHHGQITVKPSLSDGAQFELTLPLAQPE